MLTADEIEAIMTIVDRKIKEGGLRRLVGEVAAVSGDATAGYYATVYLSGDTINASAPIRCLRHYTPTVGDRVSILASGNTLFEIIGKLS